MNTLVNKHDDARAILRANDRGGYTVPTHGLYPYQWNWDSAFVALGFAEFDRARAWDEIETLMRGQWDNGMVPHILFHQPDDGYFPGSDVWQGTGPIPSSGITQPPVGMSFAVRLWRKDPSVGTDKLRAIWPMLAKWAAWFLDWRCHEGAIFVTHPWESGRDNAACWDEALKQIDPVGVGEYTRRDTSHVDASMRPTKFDYDRYIWLVQRGAAANWDDATLAAEPAFRVLDPTMNFTLLRGMRDLAASGDELGFDTTDLKEHIARVETGAERLRNPDTGFFDSQDLATGTWGGGLTNASFLCWFAGLAAPDMLPRLQELLTHCKYGVPSLDPQDPRYDAKRYWRGPTWGMMNMMIGEGLAEQGHTDLANTVREMTRDLIIRHGFAEYFDAQTGAGAGGDAFSWTAAVWLIWAGQTNGGEG